MRVPLPFLVPRTGSRRKGRRPQGDFARNLAREDPYHDVHSINNARLFQFRVIQDSLQYLEGAPSAGLHLDQRLDQRRHRRLRRHPLVAPALP